MADTSLTGTWPIDPTTPEGLFRFEIGDVVGTAHEPPDGKAEFEFIGDATILALLAAHPENRDYAKGLALESMATQLIAAAQDIQVDDIKLKTVEKANLMFLRASGYGVASAIADAASAFTIVSLSAVSAYHPWPQGTPRPYGESGF